MTCLTMKTEIKSNGVVYTKATPSERLTMHTSGQTENSEMQAQGTVEY